MGANFFIEELLNELADEISYGNPARALARLNLLLQQFEPVQQRYVFTTARILLYIGRALQMLDSPEQAQAVTKRAEQLLQKENSNLSSENIELFLLLAQDLADRDCNKEAVHFAQSAIISISSNSKSISEEQLAEFLRRYASIMECCSQHELAHVSRTLALLCLHCMAGLESQVALELLDTEFFERENRQQLALGEIQRSLNDRLRLLAV